MVGIPFPVSGIVVFNFIYGGSEHLPPEVLIIFLWNGIISKSPIGRKIVRECSFSKETVRSQNVSYIYRCIHTCIHIYIHAYVHTYTKVFGVDRFDFT